MWELLKNTLQSFGLQGPGVELVTPWLMLLLLLISAYLLLKIVGSAVRHIVVKLVKATSLHWDDKLVENGFFRHLVHIVPVVFLSLTIPEVFHSLPSWQLLLEKAINVYLILVFFLIANAVITTGSQVYSQHDVSSRVPLVGVFQIAKLIVTVIAILLTVATALDKSPAVLLSGLGALTAILLLVFKDTIQGLVAGIQIAAHKMLAHGDWLEMPSQGVDGTVLEVGLNTVKVRNWDNTISFLPTYTLISQPYKNWRGMEESDGRRFKRRIVIDPDSVDVAEDSKFKTNLGAFRQQISDYLKAHSHVNQQLTQLVRIVNPDQYGVHLEIYFFITDKRWVYFEGIAADIYEDLLVMMKQHGLKICTIKSVHS
jgi:miniconductance mechanosensitive channel